MKRRDFITAATAAGLVGAAQAAKADLIVPPANRRRRPEGAPEGTEPRRFGPRTNFITLEFFYAANKEKRNALVEKFDAGLIPLRKKVGFQNIGIFTVNEELMANERGYDAAKYDPIVFVVQETANPFAILNFQTARAEESEQFNLNDDLDFIDEEIMALRSFKSQPKIDVPYRNPERVLQLRTYNSPNYERNARKEKMFEDFELDLFRRSGMAPVFFGSALFGSMAPNVTYMLSFENDEKRREGWGNFVNSDEWKTKSKDPQYERTATRIRNLFLKPSKNSEI